MVLQFDYDAGEKLCLVAFLLSTPVAVFCAYVSWRGVGWRFLHCCTMDVIASQIITYVLLLFSPHMPRHLHLRFVLNYKKEEVAIYNSYAFSVGYVLLWLQPLVAPWSPVAGKPLAARIDRATSHCKYR